MEKMMAQLIQMVGHNNAVTEELRQDVSGLKEDVAGLQQDVSGLKQDVVDLKQEIADLDAKLEKGFADIVTVVNVLGEKVDKIETTQEHHGDMLDVLAVRTTHQEAEIQGLKRAI
jgi:predicted  nucleic acid-binding Zn-ribbon protein